MKKAEDNTTKYRLWGGHAKVKMANERALRVARFPARVLLLGATGTGKSMLARHIHYNSEWVEYKTVRKKVWDNINGRKLKEMLAWAAGKHDQEDSDADIKAFEDELRSNTGGFKLPNQRFREINLAALPEQTISSELFGYVDGAFTDANKHGSPGLFINANGGTLFLDEIADCPLSIQAKLLGVIQARDEDDEDCACYVIPNGQEEELRVNVRLICATNKDLFGEVKAGRFREDLYYRLREYEIRVPSLSELIPIDETDPQTKKKLDEKYYRLKYIDHVLEETNKKLSACKLDSDKDVPYVKKVLTPNAEETLKEYSFPGNYRELQGSLMQACLNARTRYMMNNEDGKDGEEINILDLPDLIRAGIKTGAVEACLMRDLQNEHDAVEARLRRDLQNEHDAVEARLRSDLHNEDERARAMKLFREMERIGWCTISDLDALCKDEEFTFAVPISGKKEKGKEAERGYDPVCLRNLCYLIHLIKMGEIKIGKCASELLGRSTQTLSQFLKKFGTRFEKVRKVIRDLYGWNLEKGLTCHAERQLDDIFPE